MDKAMTDGFNNLHFINADIIDQEGIQMHNQFIINPILTSDLCGETAVSESSNSIQAIVPYEISNGTDNIVHQASTILLPNDILLQLDLNNSTIVPNIEAKPLSNVPVLEDASNIQDRRLVFDSNVNDQFEIISAHKCKICGSLFERYDEILKHLETHTVTQNKYLCGTCGETSSTYESIEQLKEHMIISHNFTIKVEEEQEQVEDNSEEAKVNDTYLKVLIQHQENANKKVKCMVKGCDNSFANKEIMLKHFEFHIVGSPKRFKCSYCHKMFFIWRTCKTHLWNEHNIDVGLYECSICQSFKCLAPHNLLVHMKVHIDPSKFKPFLCSFCGHQFNRLNDLNNHANTHTTKTWSTVRCPKCDKTFARNRYLKRHLQIVHDQFKPFICNICGHKCARKAMLDLHLRQHTGEKPYKCELCEFKTGDHNSYRRHLLRHSGITLYKCSLCDYKTAQSSAFKNHMQKKHPGDTTGIFKCSLCSFVSVNSNLYDIHMSKHQRETNHSNSVSEAVVTETTVITVPNTEDEETQIGLYPDHPEDTVDTGGITIPACMEN